MSRPPRPTSSSRSNCSGGVFDWEPALRKLDELNARVEDPTLWNNADEAQAVSRERSRLAAQIDAVKSLASDLADAVGYAEMADEEGDEASLEEARGQLKSLKERAGPAELEALLAGEADGNDAYVEINSGAGGTESNDWAGMLLRMYSRWAQAHGMTVDFLEETSGEQAGIKSVTLQVKGTNAYGWMKTEGGVHRLVRISPFDANDRRQTSFASVWVYPVVDDSLEIEINEADLKVETYRASGAGGQHVNKTESAIRITHIPSGIIVACQTDRSQHRNRATAMAMLKARLYEAELQRREAAAAAQESAKTDIGWGHQIRNYVLAPYQLVKDLRTGVEKGNPDAVLGGELDEFMAAALAAPGRAARSRARGPARAGGGGGEP